MLIYLLKILLHSKTDFCQDNHVPIKYSLSSMFLYKISCSSIGDLCGSLRPFAFFPFPPFCAATPPPTYGVN